MTAVLSVPEARRLALARAGLLKPALTGLPERAAGTGIRARQRCHRIIDRFGYLQLDSVAITGARTHSIVLASRLESFQAGLGESLLGPGEPLFEYWGHEASWVPMSLYPVFHFRREAFRVHPWWGDVLGEHAKLVREMLTRIEAEGPLRSIDFEGTRLQQVWGSKLTTRVAEALWSAGDLAVRERRSFQRSFDLSERVIPAEVRANPMRADDAFECLMLKALDGHGWATTGTLAATWRLPNQREAVVGALERLRERGEIATCALDLSNRRLVGWIRISDLELVQSLSALRPRTDRGVLLSPFDPVLWDRARVQYLFGFDQVLEIYKPAEQRRYGYYCLPVMSGDRLIARVDIKANRKRRTLDVLCCHYESHALTKRARSRSERAVANALARFAGNVGLDLNGKEM